MRVGKCGSVVLALLVFSVAGCRKEVGKEVPEVGASLTSGPVLLNVGGAGYQVGDIVRINTDVRAVTKGVVILFDWRKATAATGGFGPVHMIGDVVGLPGDTLSMSRFLKFKGRDGRERNAWFATFKRRGAENYDSEITLPSGDYLVETDRHILIVDRSSIAAFVLERLGHDQDAEKEIKQRRY